MNELLALAIDKDIVKTVLSMLAENGKWYSNLVNGKLSLKRKDNSHCKVEEQIMSLKGNVEDSFILVKMELE
ncbi:hypothetical protein Tco_1391371 [Tanacetum coccineum]